MGQSYRPNLHDYDNATYYYLNTIGLSYAQVFHSCPINCTCGKTWLIGEYYKKMFLLLPLQMHCLFHVEK